MRISSKIVLPAVLALSCANATGVSVNHNGSPCRLHETVNAPEVATPSEVVKEPTIEKINEPETKEPEAKAEKYTGAPTSPGTCSGVGVSLTHSKRNLLLYNAANIH